MIKRATCKTWAKWFEKHEGVRISESTIYVRLKVAGVIGETARNKVGRLLRNGYFSEQDIREACTDLLRPLPQADEHGFFIQQGVRHGTVRSWSRELGISDNFIVSRICSSSASFVQGRDSGGRVKDFYPESAMRTIFSEILKLPKADESGFIVIDGLRHGTAEAWSCELGVDATAILKRLRKTSAPSCGGRASNGALCKFFSEPIVREALADRLNFVPQADESGLIILGDVRHGTNGFWARELGISIPSVISRINAGKIQPTKGKLKGGNLWDFYPEPAVREACADLISPMGQADKSGFVVLRDVRHGTVSSWSQELRMCRKGLSTRLKSVSATSVKGKDQGGKVHEFYPEPAVREACKDLLAKKNK